LLLAHIFLWFCWVFGHLFSGVISGGDTSFLVDNIFSPTQFVLLFPISSTELLDFLASCILNTLLFVDFLAHLFCSGLTSLVFVMVFVGCKGWVRMGITFAFLGWKEFMGIDT
jgi:hypothetical protein